MALVREFAADGMDMWSKGPGWPQQAVEVPAQSTLSPAWTFESLPEVAAPEPVGSTTIGEDGETENQPANEGTEVALLTNSASAETGGNDDVKAFLSTVKVRSRRRKMFGVRGKKKLFYFASRGKIFTPRRVEQFDNPSDVAKYWVARGDWRQQNFEPKALPELRS